LPLSGAVVTHCITVMLNNAIIHMNLNQEPILSAPGHGFVGETSYLVQNGSHSNVGFACTRGGTNEEVDVAVECRLVDLALDAV